MKVARFALLSLMLGSMVLSASCWSTKTCALVGCFDQFSATIEAASASLPPGAHRMDVTADGVMSSCTFSIPVGPLPRGGLPAPPTCSPGLMLAVGPAVTCMTVDNGVASSQRCDPVPDRVQEQLTVAGTPARVTVTQWAGDTMILQQAATPTYQNPNGPDCGPTCRQASSTWSLP